jgi:hypothetical protein
MTNALFTAGTITLEAGSDVVTGTGVSFLPWDIRVGDILKPAGVNNLYLVKERISNTSLRIETPFEGVSDLEDINYAIVRMSGDWGSSRELALQLTELIRDIDTSDLTTAFGEFTPSLKFAGADVDMTYSATRGGFWRRQGKRLFFYGEFLLTAKGSSTGAATIDLDVVPEVAKNNGLRQAVTIGFASDLASVSGAVIGLVAPNSKIVTLYQSADGAGSALTHANFNDTSLIVFSGTIEIEA